MKEYNGLTGVRAPVNPYDTLRQEPKPIRTLRPSALPLIDPYSSYRQYPYRTFTPYKSNYKAKNIPMFDYNNETEINSMADVILKNLNKQTKGWAIEGVATDTIDLIYRGTVKPIMENDYTSLAINSLVSVGETLDVVSNVIKGAIFDNWTTKEAMGYYDAEGNFRRKNLDISTGFIATDILAEVAIDPMNWITFGAWAVAKTGTKLTVQTLKEAAGDLAGELTEKAYRDIAQRATSAYINGDYDTLTKSVNEVLQTFANNTPVLAKLFDSELTKDQAITVMKQMQNATVHYNSNAIIDSMKYLVKPVETVDNFLLKTAFTGTGIYPAYKVMKTGYDEVKSALDAKKYRGFAEALKDFTKEDGTFNVFKYEDMKVEFEKYKNVIDASDRMIGKEGIPSELLEQQLSKTVYHDLDVILEMLTKFESDPIKFNKELAEYLEIANPTNALTAYILKVEEFNNLTKGGFADALHVLKESREFYRDTMRDIIAEKTHKAKLIKTDIYENLKVVTERILDPRYSESFDLGNIRNGYEKQAEVFMEYLRKGNKDLQFRIDNAMLFDADYIIKELQGAINTRFEEVTSPITKLLSMENTFADITKYAQETLDLVTKYKDDLLKQLDTSFRKELEPILEGTNMYLPEINFKKLKLMNGYMKRTDVLIDKLKQSLPMKTEGKSYANAEAFLQTSKKQGELINNIVNATDSAQKLAKAEFEFSPDAEKDIINAALKLQEVVKNDPLKFAQTYKEILPVHAEVFEEQYNNFMDAIKQQLQVSAVNGKPLDIDASELQSAWYALSRSFKHMMEPRKELVPYTVSVTPRQIIFNKAEYDAVSRKIKEFLKHNSASFEGEAGLHLYAVQNILKNRTLQEIKENRHVFRDIMPHLDYLINAGPEELMQKAFNLKMNIEQLQPEQIIKSTAKLIRNTEEKDVLVDFGNFLDYFEKLNPLKYTNAMLTIKENASILQFKQEQVISILELMSIDSVNSMFKGINRNEGFGSVINTLADAQLEEVDPLFEASKSAKIIRDYAEHYINYKRFLDLASAVKMDDKIKGNFISTIQKFADINPVDFLSNVDYYFNNIVSDTELFSNSRAMTLPKLSLDHYRTIPEIQEHLAKYEEALKAKGIDTEAHEALYDIETLEAVLDYEGLSEKLFTDPDTTYLLFDIETFGAKAKQNKIFEIGYKPYKGEGTKLALNIDPNDVMQQPSNELLSKFGYKDMNEFLSKRSGVLEDGTIRTEKMLLQKFIDMLKAHNGKVVLIGHNSEKFDIDFIVKRMYNNDMSRYDIQYLLDITKHDSLSLLREKYGFKTIPLETKNRLKRLLTSYAERQTKAGIAKLIAPNSGGLATELDNIRNAFADLRKGHANNTAIGSIDVRYEYWQMAGDIAKDIFEVLRDIKANNKSLSTHLIMPEVFDSSSDIYKTVAEKMSKHLKKEVNFKNLTELLYGYTEDAIGRYGYKKAVDFNVILSWFNFAKDDTIDFRLAKSLTSLGKSFERIKNAINNIDIIKEYQYEFDRVLALLLPGHTGVDFDWFANGGVVPLQQLDKFYYNLRTNHTDSLSKFVVLQYLFSAYSNKGLLTDYLKGQIGTEMVDFLTKTSSVFKRAQDKSFKLLDISDNIITKPKQLAYISDVFQKSTIGVLDDLGKLYEDNKLFVARVHATAKALKPTQELLDMYNAIVSNKDKNFVKTFIRNLKACTDNFGVQQLNQILSLSPEELFRHMVYEAPWFEFSKVDISNNSTLRRTLDTLLGYGSDLKKVGIDIIEEQDKYYFVLSKKLNLSYSVDEANRLITHYLDGAEIPRYKLSEIDLDYARKLMDNDEFFNQLVKVRNNLHYFSENSSVGTLGDEISPTQVRLLYERLPKSVQNKLPTLEKLTDGQLFQSPRYDHINLGSVQARRIAFDVTFKDDEGYVPKSLVSIYLKNAESITSRTKTKLLYTQMYYDNDFGINKSIFFSHSNDEEIIKAFKNNPEYVLTALVEDKKWGYKAVRLNVTSAETLAEARRLNAVVLPYHIVSKAMKVINHDMLSSYRQHWWNKLLYAYKVGYLLDPSVWLRNFIDSNLKTMGITNTVPETLKANKETYDMLKVYDKIINDVLNLSQYDLQQVTNLGLESVVEQAVKKEMAKETLTASVLINKYDGMVKDIIRMDSNKRFTIENLKFYFEKMNPEMDMELFNFIHNFIIDGPSAGMTKTWQEYYGLKDGTELWNTFVNTTSTLMEPNNQIEQVNRLAAYLILIRNGDDSNKAFYKIVKAHFDYSDKAPWEILTELIFPFYSFTMKNLEYWVDIMEQNPQMARQLSNIMQPVFNFDDTNYDELKFNRSLQYQVLSGNIPLTDEGLTLKLSPSFMDVFNLMHDPIGSAKNKMFSPLQMLLDEAIASTGDEELMNVLNVYDSRANLKDTFYNVTPVVGALARRYLEQGPEYYDRTGNPLTMAMPGLFGGTKRYDVKEYVPREYVPKTYPKFAVSSPSKQKGFSSSGTQSFSSKAYANKVYPKRYYNKWVYPNSSVEGTSGFYKRHYTKKGKSKLQMLKVPTTGYTLKYKILNYMNYFR